MKKLTFLFLIYSSCIMAQQTTPKEAFLEKWKNSKEYLLSIAEAMPEEFYGYKPTEPQMTFGDQLLHIRGNMLWLGTTYFSDQKFDRDALTKDIPTSKATIIEEVTKAFDFVSEQISKTDPKDFVIVVDFFAGKKSKLQILNLLQDHVTHHRGQLIVYSNLKGIKPPRYVGW